MAITVTFSFDEETVSKLDALSQSLRETKSAILRQLVIKEFATNAMAATDVSVVSENGEEVVSSNV